MYLVLFKQYAQTLDKIMSAHIIKCIKQQRISKQERKKGVTIYEEKSIQFSVGLFGDAFPWFVGLCGK